MEQTTSIKNRDERVTWPFVVSLAVLSPVVMLFILQHSVTPEPLLQGIVCTSLAGPESEGYTPMLEIEQAAISNMPHITQPLKCRGDVGGGKAGEFEASMIWVKRQ